MNKTPLNVRMMEFFFGNTRNKLTSMVLAIVVWAYAFGNTGHEEIREAVIRLEPSSNQEQIIVRQKISDSRLMGQPGDAFSGNIRMTLSGPRNVLARYSEESPQIIGTLFVERSGLIQLRSGDAFDLPAGLTIQSVDPSSIEVEVDALVRVQREVRPIIKGQPATGYQITSDNVKAVPKTVTLVGPKTVLEGDQVNVLSREIDVSGLSDSKTVESVELLITGDDSGLVKFDPPNAASSGQVEITLSQNLKEATAEVSVRYVVEEGVPLEINGDQSVNVTVRGIEEDILQWKENVEEGRFYLLVRAIDTNGTSLNPSADQVFWVDGSLPARISRETMKFDKIILYSAKKIDQNREEQDR
ncbi:hypothetical protein CBD41_06495 [bacterium TMED181]|nr:hypothetical protein [Planctomycetota bacterium]OUW43955.1 MAG: hypothetical protein CBD41_06495 [bacterium TMED181]